jgi:hypothetical protein
MLAIMLLLAAAQPAAAIDPPESRKCLQNRQIIGERLSADKGYFVRTRQGWWRNTGPLCQNFAANRILTSARTSDTQCSGDIVNVADRLSRIDYGACKLGSWERVDESVVPPPYQPGTG